MSKEMAFTVFCLENYKVHRNLTGKETMQLFDKHGVFDYLREFYDVLHTTGHDYINNDIDIYLKERNALPAEDNIKSTEKEDIESIVDTLTGCIPDTGKTLSDYRDERLRMKYGMSD